MGAKKITKILYICTRIHKWNLAKNLLQFFIGIATFFAIFGRIDLIKTILGCISFIISYSAIYPYNDIIDAEEDKRKKWKLNYKPIASGILNIKEAVTSQFFLFSLGIGISMFVSKWYSLLLISLLILNFLYSSPMTRKFFKKNKIGMILITFVIQYLKFSSGWIAMTTNLVLFPFWFINLLALAYTFSFLIYKINLVKIRYLFKEHRLIFSLLACGIFILYGLSVHEYPFKLPLLLLIPTSFTFLLIGKFNEHYQRIISSSKIITIIFLIFIITAFLIKIPVISSINENISEILSSFEEKTSHLFFNKNIWEKVNTTYTPIVEDLDEIDEILDVSVNITAPEPF